MSCLNCRGLGKVRDRDHLLGIGSLGLSYLIDSIMPDYRRCPACYGTGMSRDAIVDLAAKLKQGNPFTGASP